MSQSGEEAGMQETKKKYIKIVRKGPCPYMYLKVGVDFESEENRVTLRIEEFRLLISQCLKELYGDVGAAIQVDVLKYNSDNMAAILRVPSAGYVQLRSALTLCGSIMDNSCAIHVFQASAHLMALAYNSRDM